MQENCLRLMGKKLLVSLAMEGKFTGEGLQSIDDGDDILMSMARELVTERGIGESADAVWRQLQKQHSEIFGIRSGELTAPDAIAATVLDSMPEVIVPPAVQAPDVVTQLLMFGASVESVQRRKASRRPTVAVKGSNQLALF